MYIEKTVKAGKTIETYRYYSIRTGGVPEGKRRRKLSPTPERIEKANLRHRTDRLRQLMNANFNDREYWSMTLTYETEPESIRQVRNDAADFVKRLRKCARLFGVELKFIYVIGAGKHRRHIHITVNAMPDMAIFAGCWIHGHVSMTQLYSDGQYRDLADYYIRNAKETKEQEIEHGEKPGQMYVCSKNLTQPEETRKVINARYFREEPKPKKGYYVEKDTVWNGFTMTGFPLLHYTMIKEKDERDKTVHLHQCTGQRGRQSKVRLSDAVRKRREGARSKGRPLSGGHEPKGSHAGSAYSIPNKGKRRE